MKVINKDAKVLFALLDFINRRSIFFTHGRVYLHPIKQEKMINLSNILHDNYSNDEGDAA